MNKSLSIIFSFAVLMSIAPSIFANTRLPEVIHQGPATKPITEHVNPVVGPSAIRTVPTQEQIDAAVTRIKKENKPPVINPIKFFPIESKTLRVGRVQNRTVNLPGMTRPVFLVGADKTSVAWLRQRKELLKEQGAIGIVVKVKDANQLAQLRNIAPELDMFPYPAADEYAKLLGVNRYPVLVTKTSVTQ